MLKDGVAKVFRLISVKNLYNLFGLILIIVPVSFYLGWSIAYNTWTDVGLYSFAAPLVVFGILVLMLTAEKYGAHTTES